MIEKIRKQVNYEAFYLHSNQLYILEYIMNNRDMFDRASCPFAGSGIPHRELMIM